MITILLLQLPSKWRVGERNTEYISGQMDPRERFIKAGDTIIVYQSHTKKSALKIEPGACFTNAFGTFHHDDFIGKPFGYKVYSSKGGWIALLKLTPELWRQSFTIRTQILFHTDVSQIIFRLHVQPGSVVVESGTGSGSLSHSFAQAVAPLGHLFTFEFNEDRVVKAREDFAAHGLSDLVTVTHRNVCELGFPRIHGGVDCVFLDLPTPWEVELSIFEHIHQVCCICRWSLRRRGYSEPTAACAPSRLASSKFSAPACAWPN
jgi:tRNA (adenine57-N1/adenine58-N1)-methyltransferase